MELSVGMRFRECISVRHLSMAVAGQQLSPLQIIRPPRPLRVTLALATRRIDGRNVCAGIELQRYLPSYSLLIASYAISVRQVGGLPVASFRSHLMMGSLAIRLAPNAGPIADFQQQVIR